MADTPDNAHWLALKSQTDWPHPPGTVPGFFMATCGINLTERQMRPHAAGGFLLFVVLFRYGIVCPALRHAGRDFLSLFCPFNGLLHDLFADHARDNRGVVRRGVLSRHHDNARRAGQPQPLSQRGIVLRNSVRHSIIRV